MPDVPGGLADSGTGDRITPGPGADATTGNDSGPVGPPDVPIDNDPDVGVIDPPGPDVGLPDTAEPEPDVAAPEPDVAEPEPDVAEPEPDVAEPEPDVAEPEPDVAEPEPDVPETLDTEEVVQPDTADVSDEGPGPDAGEPDAPPGLIVYEKVEQFVVVGDLHAVRWHPSAQYAILLGNGGDLIRYDADTQALTPLETLGTTVNALDVDPAGAFFRIVGLDSSGDGAVWDLLEDGSFTEPRALPQGEPHVVRVHPDGQRWAVGADGDGPQNHVYTWVGDEPFQWKAYAEGTGLNGLMFADSAYGGMPAIVTAEGINGADSRTWVIPTDVVVGNNWSPGFGNPGCAQWRPGGSYGIVCGATSNVLYVFDGSWDKHYTPAKNNGGTNNDIGWKADGTRALIVGRPTGSPMEGTVIEHRPGALESFAAGTLLNASIPGFAEAPYDASFSTHLLGVDWRPGACDEGLIVGMDTGTTFSPTFGMVIRFWDSTDPACE